MGNHSIRFFMLSLSKHEGKTRPGPQRDYIRRDWLTAASMKEVKSGCGL